MSDPELNRPAAPAASDVSKSDEAIEWLVRLSSGRATPKDRLAFLRWRERSAEHEAAAREAEAILRGVGETRQADRLRRGSEPLPFVSSRMSGARRFSRRLVFAAAAAASVAVAALALPAVGPLAALYADHATSVGQHKRIELADGSVALLNTATALSVDQSGAQRRIVLHEGEAYFEVARDPNRPFVVAAGDVRVQAVGTAFSVRRSSDGATVVVGQGIVEVSAEGGVPVRVEAGQRLDVGRDLLKAEQRQVTEVDIDAALAWQRGKLIFNRRPLASVVAEIERYHAGRIVIASERLRTLQVSGVFDLADSDRLLQAIEETTKAEVVRLPLLTVLR